MARPAVRNLNSLVNELGQSVRTQKSLIDDSIAANQQAGEAQVEGLQAQQQQAFGQIEQGAQDKGMFFSGFSPDAQAQYTSSTYLPALANLQAQIAQTRSQLLGQKADLDTNVFNKAFDTREGDVNRRFSYDERIGSQQFSSQQAERDRQFQAQQAQEQRQFTAQQNAADRGAAAARAQQAAASQNVPDIKKAVQSFLNPRRGTDKKVSPATFKQGLEVWMAAGGAPSSYYQEFQGYVNMSHSQDYF